MMTHETRSLMERPELRAEGGKRTLAGYAAVFGSTADIGGYFREVIAPGAFADTLLRDDVRALFDHDSGRLLGRKSAGTLRLAEDAKGLRVEIDLPDTSDGRDVAQLVERGDLDGMSFGFMVRKEQWDETVDPPTRTILAVDLREVSAVTFPAYADTSLALRSRDAAKGQSDADQAARNRAAAERRISASLRKAEQDQKFRGIRPE